MLCTITFVYCFRARARSSGTWSAGSLPADIRSSTRSSHYGSGALEGFCSVYHLEGPANTLGVTASASQWSPRSTSTEPESCVSLAPQVIYSLTPLWSALIAWVFLGNDDGLGPLGWAGGAVILMASILATTGAKQEDLRDKELNKS